MGDTAVKAENISKKYRVPRTGQPSYDTLRDTISGFAKGILRKKIANSSIEDFWALRDVNFEIKQGERVAFIGKNGAGKSTLLKILSRITEPTEGKITMYGKLASLLEVGTGFHPELTGRENIFLNGAILGMSKKEIKKRFDQIVMFSELEDFLDLPIKRYSSGMYVRLAFSVAVHLKSDILILDEVLAVGDLNFQKKSIDKMKKITVSEGRTVLFVSHNLDQIKALCSKGFLIDKGKIIMEDKIEKVVERYKGC